MPNRRRVSFQLRTGVLAIGIGAGVLLLTAVPTGQQVQGRGRQTQAPQVPTVGAPSISVPSMVPPVATQVGQGQPTTGPWIDSVRLQGLIEAERLGVDYVPGEALVKFKDGVTTEGQTRAVMALRGGGSASIEWTRSAAVVRDPTQPNSYLLVDQLRAQPEVEYAEPNFIARTGPVDFSAAPPEAGPKPAIRGNRGSTAGGVTGTPTDSDYAAYQWNFQLISMPDAWDVQPGGRSDIIVAVIDSGITAGTGLLTYPIWTGSTFQTTSMPYAPNPDLASSRHVLAKDYVSGAVPGAPLVDTSGHGTHVSGTIAEDTNNGFLVSGMAYNVKIMPLKVCVSYWDIAIAQGFAGISGFPFGFSSQIDAHCAYNDIANAIMYAVDNGARVMNISIGGGQPSTLTLQNALIYAAGKGAFVSISMGNDFTKGNPTTYPAFYAASIEGVMSVAAVGPNAIHASYSNTGSYCEIAAPGGDVNGSRTDLGEVWQSTIVFTDHPMFQSTARFDRYNKDGYTGTSMAAPHVAGLAALLMSQAPTLTGAQVERIIRTSAKDIGTAGKDDTFGYGLIQPRRALFGYGPLR